MCNYQLFIYVYQLSISVCQLSVQCVNCLFSVSTVYLVCQLSTSTVNCRLFVRNYFILYLFFTIEYFYEILQKFRDATAKAKLHGYCQNSANKHSPNTWHNSHIYCKILNNLIRVRESKKFQLRQSYQFECVNLEFKVRFHATFLIDAKNIFDELRRVAWNMTSDCKLIWMQ